MHFDWMGLVNTVFGMVAGFALAIVAIQEHWLTVPGH